MMQAILYSQEKPYSLHLASIPKPIPLPNELLIKVKATALNRADLMQKKGLYPPPKGASNILGLEVAGVVAAAGSACSKFTAGDEVMALLAGGGYAEYVTCSERLLMPKPKGYSFEQAAAIPEAFITAYQALFDLGQLRKGETALIHGGASGVGTAAIQLAKLAEAHVLATAGTEEKIRFCEELGADKAINYKTGDFEPHIKALSYQMGADVIIDIAGSSHYEQNMKSVAIDGRWVVLAMMGGRYTDNFDFAKLLMKRVHLMGSTLRARDLAYKSQLIEAFAMRFLPAFEQNKLRPIIDCVFDWQEAEAAHARMEQNMNVGKVVLRVGS